MAKRSSSPTPVDYLIQYISGSPESTAEPDDPPTTVGATAADAAEVSSDLCDEQGFEVQETEILAACYQKLLQRLITKYYGVWPEDCTEDFQHDELVKLFFKIKRGMTVRTSLADDVQRNCDVRRSCVLDMLDLRLEEQLYDYREQLEALKDSMKKKEGREHPEVAAFLNDLKAHSEAFNRDAQNEVIDQMAKEIALAMNVPVEAALDMTKTIFDKVGSKKGGVPGKRQ